MKRALFGLFLLTLATGAGATTYPGNGQSDFGGPIGLGSLTLTDNGTVLTGTITKGTNGFNDSLVIYLDTVAGGATSLPTSGEIGNPDYGRRSVVNEFGSGITPAFTAGFAADYAIVLAPNHNTDSIYQVFQGANANTINFVAGAGLTNMGNANAASYTFTVNLAQIGITPNSGSSFTFITTYENPIAANNNDATFRSFEAFADSPTQNGFNDTQFTNFSVYSTVPEPSTWIAGGLSITACVWLRLRRRHQLKAAKARFRR